MGTDVAVAGRLIFRAGRPRHQASGLSLPSKSFVATDSTRLDSTRRTAGEEIITLPPSPLLHSKIT